MRRSSWRRAVAGAVVLVASVAVAGVSPGGVVSAEAAAGAAVPDGPVFTAAAAGPVFTAAGDIDGCAQGQDTAKLVGKTTGPVATIGDNAYPDGSASDYARCYDPTWGTFKDRTHPVPGNHDYDVSKATPYYQYFGAAAGAPGSGWYSYDVGSWHVVALNSNCDDVDCSKQTSWLDTDLTAHPAECILAYWHHPRFTSGTSGGNDAVGAFWKVLYRHGATLVLNGHDHDYERFAPQDPSGHADPAHGIRELIVGTGGAALGSFAGDAPNSEVRNNRAYGVIELTLGDGAYDWRFVPASGSSFTDSGSDTCQGTPPPAAPTPTTAVPAPAPSEPAPPQPPGQATEPGPSGQGAPGAADGGQSGPSDGSGGLAPDPAATGAPAAGSRQTPASTSAHRPGAAKPSAGDSRGGTAGSGGKPARPVPTDTPGPAEEQSGVSPPAPIAAGSPAVPGSPEPADGGAGSERSIGGAAAKSAAAVDDPTPLPVAIAGLIHPPAAPSSDRRPLAGLALALLAVDSAALAAARRRRTRSSSA